MKIAFNAKVQRPSVCNAMETLLVHKDIADKFLPMMLMMYNSSAVEIRGDKAVQEYSGSGASGNGRRLVYGIRRLASFRQDCGQY